MPDVLIGRWLRGCSALLACAGIGCIEPQPQTLTLPSTQQEDRAVRTAMVEFNEDRLQNELAAIDSATRHLSIPLDSLSGGVLLQHLGSEHVECPLLSAWRATAGDRVQWTWQAFTLDGNELSSGQDEFMVGQGSVPSAFHQAAEHLGHNTKAVVWSPSLSAFGVRGIPGEIPPYTPVRLEVEQARAVRDTAWWSGVRRGEYAETMWLESYVGALDSTLRPTPIAAGIWATIHTTMDSNLFPNEAVALNIRTASMDGSFERETQMEWIVGTQDQLVPAIEETLLVMPNARTISIWTTSESAFGAEGSPEAGIPARTPLRFDIEIIQR